MLRTIILSVTISAVTSIAVLVVGVAILRPVRAEAQSTVIQAREFDVVDDSGQILARLASVNNGGSLTIYDQNGTIRVFVNDSGLDLSDQQEILRTSWVTNDTQHGGTGMLTLFDVKGNLIARLSQRADGLGELAFRDKNGDFVRTDP